MTFSSLLLPALFGMGTGLALIVAIGAQNAYVLKVGLQGVNRVILPVIAVCAASDAVLIIAGVAGVGALIAAAPQALVVGADRGGRVPARLRGVRREAGDPAVRRAAGRGRRGAAEQEDRASSPCSPSPG